MWRRPCALHSAGLGSTHEVRSCSTCPQGERPEFEGQHLNGVPDLKGLRGLSCSNLSKATERVFSSSGETTGDCCLGKVELSPNTETFPDLFTNIWCSFLDGVQAEIQPQASAASCPPPHPPGENQGWGELVRGKEGTGLLLLSGRRGCGDAGAGLCSEGHSKSTRGISVPKTVPAALTQPKASGWVTAGEHGWALLAQPLGPAKPVPGWFLMGNK